MDLTLAILRQVGVSDSVLKSTSDTINTIFDLIIVKKKEALLKQSIRKSNFSKTISGLLENSECFTPYSFKSPYILLVFGAPKKALMDIINTFNVFTINDLYTLNINHVSDTISRISVTTIKKILYAIKEYEEWLSNIQNQEQLKKNIILYYFYGVRQSDKSSVLYEIQEFIDNFYLGLSISESEIREMIEVLVSDEYLYYFEGIYYFPTNIYYDSNFDSINIPEQKTSSNLSEKTSSLIEVLNSDYKDIEILRYRLKGLTLNDIGELYGITRERIRQRQQKLLKKIGTISEVEKYREIFETYAFSKNDFLVIFNESSEVYELLELILKKGTEEAEYYVLDSKDVPSKKKMEYLLERKFHLSRFGELKRITKVNFCDELLYVHKNETLNPDSFIKIYNSEAEKYPELDLYIANSRSIWGIVDRSDYAIRTYGHVFRYFDFNFTETDWTQLKEIIDDLGMGCYSMFKLFNENKDFMKQLDIRDEYELHNLYKKYENLLNDNVKLTRSPEFMVGDIIKQDFIFQILMEFSGDLVVDCVEYIHEEYGLRKNTMGSYLSANFRSYIDDGKVVSNVEFVDDEIITNLKIDLQKDIYMKKDISKIIEQAGEKLTTVLLAQLGYYMTGNVVYKKELKNITAAFSSLVLSGDYYRKTEDSIGRSVEMSAYLYRMEMERKLMVLAKEYYVSANFLEERGISVEIMNDFVNKIYEFLPDIKYFSVFSLEQKGFSHLLLDYGFERIFYERLILTSDKFKFVNKSSPRLFAKGLSVPATLEQFYSDKLALFESGVDIYDFVDDLFNEFHIDFDMDNIKTSLKRYGSFYSDELQKIYFDKETYLNEVYGK